MSLRDVLETFEVRQPSRRRNQTDVDFEELDAAKAAGYEAGYASGWEDAKAAEAQSRVRIEAEFERNIEALSFTYHEAVDRVRGEMKVFVDAFLDAFLPKLMPDILSEHLRSELLAAAEERLDQPLEIVTSPDCSKLVRDLIAATPAIEVELTEDPSLAVHQVFVRIAEREKEINLTPVVDQLRTQLGALSSDHTEKETHG